MAMTDQVRIHEKNLSELRKLKLKKKKSGIIMSLTQVANQAITLGLKAAKEHQPT